MPSSAVRARRWLAAHLPLYAQVENVIIDRVSDGSLPADSRLPLRTAWSKTTGGPTVGTVTISGVEEFIGD